MVATLNNQVLSSSMIEPTPFRCNGNYDGALWAVDIPAECPHCCHTPGLTEGSLARHCKEECELSPVQCPLPGVTDEFGVQLPSRCSKPRLVKALFYLLLFYFIFVVYLFFVV